MARGTFITLEGGDGAGKSTQAARLAEALHEGAREVVLTREPGGAPGAEAIRRILVEGPQERWSPLSEALLFAAAREEHLRATIRPALERGAIVVCDRFSDSTRAYQGGEGGVDSRVLDRLEEWVVADARPDVTFILDIEPALARQRAAARGQGGDRFESRGGGFHERLRSVFLAIAEVEPERCVVIDASRTADEVSAEIIAIARERVATREGVRN